ncbi:Glu/Leu/Phe/Val dehydrogenase [Alkalihalobacillus sp. LMS39]|uniref:Leu/Phe/Val dehydrogenase n=1 Tax=Alkalihalobacillus sp. LMS39 TaxID=2924032 RepID=UPI001FB558CC|nr:Glu/Leu/Phe/Val dehydrogenase [Alkalihalobacillus sp. LMS39]UOE94896.1 leucine dehydrogenase [Alkalihalobacillus sp. LMS39]
MSLLERDMSGEVSVLQAMSEHEQIVFCNDSHTGLKAIIAIHDTTLGPALGGCRMHPYSTMSEAINDVLRLSKGMTYKCAAADVDFGGGKAVIIGDPRTQKSPEMFRAFGQYVASLNGRFYTGTDMGTTMDDFVHALKETQCIVGVPEIYGGSGDSSIPTAEGVINGIKATNQVLFGHDDVAGKVYAIQGLGKVGFKVAEQLLYAGGRLIVTDINEQVLEQIKEVGKHVGNEVTVVKGDDIYRAKADVFVPCALGGIINDDTIEQLTVKAIVGSANNQLQQEHHASVLVEKGILYAPDYIVNSGGLIQVADELYGSNKERVLTKTKAIYFSLLEVFQQASREQMTTVKAANEMCEKRIQDRKERNSFFLHSKRPKWDV